MSLALTPTLQKYAILTATGIIGNGNVNIQNYNYGALVTPIYNVNIKSTGNPKCEDIPVAFDDLHTLVKNLYAYSPPVQIDYPGPFNFDGIVDITPGNYRIVILPQPISPPFFSTLNILNNTILNFDALGDPNAIFIIIADCINCGTNVTMNLLNGAQYTNVFFLATTITFTGTSKDIVGILYAGKVIVNNLSIKGHIFCEPTNLIVTGTLNVFPISDICFVKDKPIVAKCLDNYLVCIEKNAFEKNTPIETDQGIFYIQDLNSSHTIRGEPIVTITKTKCLDNYLVCIEKNAFEKNCPSQRMVITKEEKIFYKNKMIPVYKCIGSYFNNFVHKIPYNGETLYNILLKKHSNVRVNNLVCETFKPSTLIAQLYATNLLTDDHVNHINEFNNQKHKELKKNTFHGLLNKF